MDRNVLTEMLADASGKRAAKNAAFEFSDQDKASVIVAGETSMFTIDEVNRVELKDGYAVLRSGRADLYLVGLDRIIGLKLHRSKRESAGFVP